MKNRKLKNNRVMSYRQVSQRLWEDEGKVGKPISEQRVMMIERSAVKKLKEGLAAQGFDEKDIGNFLSNLGGVDEYQLIEQ